MFDVSVRRQETRKKGRKTNVWAGIRTLLSHSFLFENVNLLMLIDVRRCRFGIEALKRKKRGRGRRRRKADPVKCRTECAAFNRESESRSGVIVDAKIAEFDGICLVCTRKKKKEEETTISVGMEWIGMEWI